MATKGKFFELLTASVAGGSTIRHAAAEHGCSTSHAYHLSREPEFRQRVAAIRSEATSAAVGQLTDAATKAVQTLLELLGKEQDPTVRLQASKAILTHLSPISELGELRERLGALEAEANGSQGRAA